jgi:hypothetical protein
VKGAKEVEIRSTGYAKHCVMVMLYVVENGHELPPYIIPDCRMIMRSLLNMLLYVHK